MRDRKLTGIEMGRIPAEAYRSLPPSGIVVVLDNIRSAHNVGSVLRSADAFKADKVYMCGISPVPPSPEIHKSALGAEDSVPWEKRQDTAALLRELRVDGYRVVAVEQTVNSVKLPSFVREESIKYALVLGNEVDGISDEALAEADMALEIPQFGSKHSLNVSVCAGIILYHFAAGKK